MGRPRKPTALLELTGAFKKDPQRKRSAEPLPEGPLGDPPAHLKAKEKAIWAELQGIVPARVLAKSDRWLMEVCCVTMHRLRTGEAQIGERRFLLTCLGRMGLTPSDRSKIAVAPEAEMDELAKLAQEVVQ